PRQETQVYDVSQHKGSVSVPPLVPNPDRPEPVPLSNTESAVRTNQQRKPDQLFDAVCKVCGHDPKRLTSAERGRINRALKDLRTVQATPEQIRVAASRWKQIYPNATLTPTAIASHWSRLTAAHQEANAEEVDPELERIRNANRRQW
ncbi:MAG TPA: hypothetical protein VIG24_00885, partial [Acidimicrobiia bacterium]